MTTNQISVVWRTAVVAAVIFMTGCASVASGPQGRVDLDRMQHAIALDDVGYVRSAVESRAITVNQNVPGMGYEATPLITLAARNAALNTMRYLITNGANVNVRTPDYDTPLMLAAFFQNEDKDRGTVTADRHDQAVRMLVEAGAEIENLTNSYTPLSYAAYQGRENTLRYLIEKGARVNADAQGRTINVNTPLMMATMQGHQNAARYLLRAGADAGVRVDSGMTAAEFAQKYKHSHLMQMLRCAEGLKQGEAFAQRCEQ